MSTGSDRVGFDFSARSKLYLRIYTKLVHLSYSVIKCDNFSVKTHQNQTAMFWPDFCFCALINAFFCAEINRFHAVLKRHEEGFQSM
ncbi:unnamed protein product [Arctogadus glacialis]